VIVELYQYTKGVFINIQRKRKDF